MTHDAALRNNGIDGRERGRGSLRALTTAFHVLLALLLCAVFVMAAPLDPSPSVLIPWCALCVAAAALASSALGRDRDGAPPARSLAALYVFAALVLPAPWPPLLAAASAAYIALRSRASLPVRCAWMAHTIVVVGLFEAVLLTTFGDARMVSVLRAAVTGHAAAPLAGAGHSILTSNLLTSPLTAALLLLSLVCLYVVFDELLQAGLRSVGLSAASTASIASTCNRWVRRPSHVLRDLVAPSVGVVAAVLYVEARPLVALVVPIVLGLHQAFLPPREDKADHYNDAGDAGGADDARHVALPSGAVTYAQTSEAVERLDAVLGAVRSLGGNHGLTSVTRALVEAATRLTAFRTGTVYLYAAHAGVFEPCAAPESGTDGLHGEAIPRHAAERMMSHRHLLGYSYYAPLEQARGMDHVMWRAGDVLLVPLLLQSGDVTGFISLDRPADGRVPSAGELAPLETVAALGASVIARLRHTDEVMHLAATDGLTGLLNRRALEERLAHEVAASGYRRPVALMMIDLDDFGAINNVHGHLIGDEALRTVSGVIRAHLRQADAGGRYGGDEFVVILPGLDSLGALAIADRLRAALVEATAHAAAEGRLPEVFTSIGVASIPDDAATAEALIKAADDALYISKRQGKNQASLRPVA